MAVTAITKQVLGRNTFKDVTLTSLTSTTDGFEVAWDAHDERAVLLVLNSGESAATVQVKKGNGLQGVNDLAEFSVGAGELSAVTLDSGNFKNVTGEKKGKVVITGSATSLKMALVELY